MFSLCRKYPNILQQSVEFIWCSQLITLLCFPVIPLVKFGYYSQARTALPLWNKFQPALQLCFWSIIQTFQHCTSCSICTGLSSKTEKVFTSTVLYWFLLFSITSFAAVFLNSIHYNHLGVYCLLAWPFSLSTVEILRLRLLLNICHTKD